MTQPLAGRTAVITGGTSGIGLATARLLVEAGSRVVVTGTSPERISSAARTLGEAAVVLRSDVASLDDVASLEEHVRAQLGTVDLLHVNAGVTVGKSFEDTLPEDFDRVMSTNVRGAYFTMQSLAPLVSEGGSIVLTTSVSGVRGLPSNSAYAASKAAMRSMTRTFARELLPRGIRVNAVSPGPIDTGILDRSLSPEAAAEAKERFAVNNPMHRFGQPDEVARAVLFLAFDATFTTGAELPVDGGASML